MQANSTNNGQAHQAENFSVIDEKFKLLKEIGDGLQSRVFLVSPYSNSVVKRKSSSSDDLVISEKGSDQ